MARTLPMRLAVDPVKSRNSNDVIHGRNIFLKENRTFGRQCNFAIRSLQQAHINWDSSRAMLLLSEGDDTRRRHDASARLPLSATLMNPIAPEKFREIPARRSVVDSRATKPRGFVVVRT